MSFPGLREQFQHLTSNDNMFGFQALDWHHHDVQVLKKDVSQMSFQQKQVFYNKDKTPNQSFSIDVIGVGKNGESCVVHINEFKPYFFIQLPPVEITETKIKVLLDFFQTDKQFLNFNMRNELCIDLCKVEHYFSFHGYQWNTKKAFLKLVFHSNRCFKRMARSIEKGCKLPFSLFPDLQHSTYHYFPLYESNTEALIRFFHDRKLNPSGWIQLPPYKYALNNGIHRDSNAFIEVTCVASDVQPMNNETIGKLMIASFDIEADSSHGDFPVSIKDYTKPSNEIILLYLNLLNAKKLVTTLRIERWLKHLFGLSTTLDEKTKDTLSRAYTEEKLDVSSIAFRDVASNVITLFNLATSSSLHEGDVVNVHTPCKKSTEKDNVIAIKTIDENVDDAETETDQYSKLYLLKKKRKWVKLIDADGTKSKTELRIDRENGFRSYQAMTSMEWKRRKVILHKKLTALLTKSLPALAGDKVIQIGTVFWRFGETEPFLKHLIALDTCDPIEGVVVESFATEGEVLLRWSEVMREFAPNIVTGYNIFGFDYKFMWERADALGIAGAFGYLSTLKEYITTTPHRKHLVLDRKHKFMPGRKGSPMQCTCDHYGMHSKLIEKELNSAGLGENRMFFMDIPGMVQIDMLKDIMKDHNLSSYRLDDVASHFIHGKVLSFENVVVYGDEKQSYTALISDNNYGIRSGDFVHLYRTSVIGEEQVENNRKFKVIKVSTNKDSTFTFQLECTVDLNEDLKYQWGLGKDDVSPQDIFRMQKEGSAERAIIGKYCVQDCQLVLTLMMKLQTVSNNLGMSKVCCVPFQYIFTRGQGIKTFSLVNRECNLRGYRLAYRRADGRNPALMNPQEQHIIYKKGFYAKDEDEDDSEDEEKETYQGAYVLDPKPGVYLDESVAVLDYSSLYPSSIISHNLSADTIILEPKYQGDEGADTLRKFGLEFEDVTYDNYRYVRVGKKFEKQLNTANPTITCRFIQPKKQSNGEILDEDRGIIPQTLRILLSQRKVTRNKIKTENDPFVCAVLDGMQLAYKVTANSVYGSLGASTSPICFKQIAASTTAVGRNLLIFAKTFVEENFEGAEIVYGDTDSIFINFHPKDENGKELKGHEALKKSIELGVLAGKQANKHLRHPHDLEYEKTFYPFVLLSKKRYVGMKYEKNPNKCNLSYMGIVLKRRDNAPIVKKVYADVIDSFMQGKTILESIQGLRANIKKLIDGGFPLDYLILSKSLKTHYDNPEQIVHKVLADRMAERDPGNKPQANDRIPYAYIDMGNKKVALQGERVEHPDFIRNNNLKIDASFYISNQISKPVSQIYALILEQLPGYKHKNDTDHFTHMRRKLQEEGRSDVKIAKKIDDTRISMATEILFGQYLRAEKNKREGSRTITDFFNRI